MRLVVIGGEDFRFYLSRKVFDWALPAFLRYYKDKRPPPVPGEHFDAAVAIRFTHFNNPFYF